MDAGPELHGGACLHSTPGVPTDGARVGVSSVAAEPGPASLQALGCVAAPAGRGPGAGGVACGGRSGAAWRQSEECRSPPGAAGARPDCWWACRLWCHEAQLPGVRRELARLGAGDPRPLPGRAGSFPVAGGRSARPACRRCPRRGCDREHGSGASQSPSVAETQHACLVSAGPTPPAAWGLGMAHRALSGQTSGSPCGRPCGTPASPAPGARQHGMCPRMQTIPAPGTVPGEVPL